MSNNYAPCFSRIDFVVIPSYIELPWFILWFTDLVLNIQSKGQQLNYPLIKELKITFPLKSVTNGATLTRHLTFE